MGLMRFIRKYVHIITLSCHPFPTNNKPIIQAPKSNERSVVLDTPVYAVVIYMYIYLYTFNIMKIFEYSIT